MLETRASAQFKLELGRSAHELLNKCRACALCPADNQLEQVPAKLEASGIKSDQFRAPLLIRQRKLDRLVNTARPGSQRRLELVRAVGGEYEYDFGVFPQPIHFIQQFIEESFLARPPHLFPRAGDQVHIFDNHHRGLQEAVKAKIFVEQADLLGGDQKSGVIRYLSSQVMNGVRFAGPRRTVKQKPLFRREAKALDVASRLDEAAHVAVQ